MSFYLVVIVSEAFIIADGNYTFATGIGVGGFGIGVAIVLIRSDIVLRICSGFIIRSVLGLLSSTLRAVRLIFLSLGNHPQGSSELLSVSVTI